MLLEEQEREMLKVHLPIHFSAPLCGCSLSILSSAVAMHMCRQGFSDSI